MPHVIPPTDCYLVPVGHAVAAGEPVEVSDEDAESLIEQGWKAATKAEVTKAEKAAKAEAAEDPDPEPTTEGDA